MYKKIYIPTDNSTFSNFGVDVGINIAKKFGSSCTGSHVYAGSLHDSRFKHMEGGLPDKYKQEEELLKQRDVHNSLIDKGLRVISDSFLDVFENKCIEADIPFKRRCLEGKNYHVLVNDIADNDYDLVIIGALGLGTVKDSIIGSVCERVVRRVRTDVLVIKNTEPVDSGKKIVVAVDGSPQSFGGLKSAIAIARAFNVKVEVISAFDPYFHYVAFNNIVDVLSSEAAEIFKFEEQEKLHEEIIDSGLAKIYQSHLNMAKQIAKNEDMEVSTTLLDGKAFEQVLRYVRKTKPWMLVVGRIGVHSENGMDIGSSTENLLRLAPCHLLITSSEFRPPIEEIVEFSIAWTKEAEERISGIPVFAQGMAKKAIYEYAVENDFTIITSDVIDKVMEKMLPESAMKAMGRAVEKAVEKKAEMSSGISWAEEAIKRVKELYPLHGENMARRRVEKYARINNQSVIKKDTVERVLLH